MSTIQANYHAEMLELPSKDRSNDVFSPAVWRALAAEYLVQLDGGLSVVARRDSLELIKHVEEYAFSWGSPSLGAVQCVGNVGVAPSIWYPVPDADPYRDFADMEARYRKGGDRHMMVSGEFCDDHPVFLPRNNVMFRAWHDAGHLAHGLGFSANEEVELFRRSATQADRDGVVMAPGARRALFSESVYQLAAAHVLGDFPATQTVAALGPVGQRLFDVLVG